MANRPPGPKGEPVFGSSRRYARDPFRFVEALETAYGDVSRFDMGPIDMFVVTDPELIERVLVSEHDRYRKADFGRGAIDDLLGDGLLLSEGETWRQQRALANPAFGMDRLAGMADRITDHAESLVAGWSPGERIDAEREMTHVTLNVILDLMMGVELPPEDIRRIQDQLVPLGARFEPDPIRFAAPDWLPMPGDVEYARAVDALDGILDDIIARRRGTTGTEEDGPMDFLSILMRARDRGEQSAEQLRDEMMTMLLAGHDTTALTLTYTWYLLSKHPEVEQRLHDEVTTVLDGDRPGMAHVREFEYLDWVLDEAMRLYPPVYTIFRSPVEHVSLGGYEIPPSASVMLPQWAVHRSKRYWEDPETFDPERWRPERQAERHRFTFFPFGGGPRHCIGKHLALLEAKLIIATVVTDYHLEFEGDDPLELLPSLTVHPREEMTMTVQER